MVRTGGCVPLILHVLTAVSRPENLPRITESLAAAARDAPVSVAWRWKFDLDKHHVGGQELKNRMLGEITDGWVWILDDDTLVHPDLLHRIAPLTSGVGMIVVSQSRADGDTLVASPENMQVGGIDIGQAIMLRSAIGEHRIPEMYDGDGVFLTEIADGAMVEYVDEVLSLHNALDPRFLQPSCNESQTGE